MDTRPLVCGREGETMKNGKLYKDSGGHIVSSNKTPCKHYKPWKTTKNYEIIDDWYLYGEQRRKNE